MFTAPCWRKLTSPIKDLARVSSKNKGSFLVARNVCTTQGADRYDKCSLCQSVKPEQAREPLQPHPVPDRPWQQVATDLFTFENRNYIVLVDYHSNFTELDYLPDTSAQAVIYKLKMHFARHGVPDAVVSGNGPQYSSSGFRRFAT